MAHIAYFFNSKADRKYNADSLGEWLKPFFTNGVFNGGGVVTANDNMTITVAMLTGFINGKAVVFDAAETFDLQVASGTLDRIDSVVLRRDDTQRDIYLTVLTGSNASTPVPPVIQREDGIYDLKLADIYVKKGVIKVMQENITDTRLDSSVCGFVTTTIETVDTTTLFNQYLEWYNTFTSTKETEMTAWQQAQSTAFTTWYNNSTALWTQEVESRIDDTILSLETLVESNGNFIPGYPYIRGALLNYDIGDGIVRGYLCINNVPENQGILPTNATYFMLVTREGAQGVGIGLTPRGSWNYQTPYVQNDLVLDNYIYWWCKTPNTNSQPAASNTNWEKQWDLRELVDTQTTTTNTQTTAISSSPTTTTDGNVLSWKLTGNTVVSGNTLVGTKPTKIKSVGKNLFNLQDHIAWLIANGDGVAVTEESGETVVSFDNNDYYSDRYTLNCKANTQYTFSFDCKVGGTSSFLIYYTDGTTSQASLTSSTYSRITLTSTSGKTISSITWSYSGTVYKVYIKNFHLEDGTGTTYEPYKSSEVNITNGVELHKIDGITTDILYSTCDKVQNIKKYITVANDVTVLGTTQTNVDIVVICPLSKLAGNNIVLTANDFIATRIATSKTTPNNNASAIDLAGNYWKHYLSYSANAIVITVPKGTYTTLAQAQTALAGTEILYQSANAVKSNLIDELTMSGQLQSFVNGTVFIESSTSTIGTFTATIPTNKAAQGNSTIYAIRNLGKMISSIATKVLGKIDKSQIINNLAATVAGNVLDATQGKVLYDKIDEVGGLRSVYAANVDVANDVLVYALSETIPAGTYIAITEVIFYDGTNNTGIRSVQVGSNDMRIAATPNENTIITNTAIIHSSGSLNTTVILRQTSGGSMLAFVDLYLVKLRSNLKII